MVNVDLKKVRILWESNIRSMEFGSILIESYVFILKWIVDRPKLMKGDG